jgi:murein DD-endopeptidase MepM/ murein hydrolase activator NlpD
LDKPKEQSEETKISSSPSTTSLSTEAADPCGCIRPLSAGGSSTVEGDGSVDSGSGAGGVACLAAPRKGVLANPYLRAFMRALGEAESNGSYTKTNSGRCYGRYQFCPFGTWPDIAGEPDGLGGTFPTDITKATPAQQDSAFVAAWNKEAKNRKGKNENIFDISNLISTLQNEGIDAVFDKANRGASATAGITRYGMCGAWTPLCHSSIDPRQGKQSLIRRVYQQVLTEEKAGTCGGGRTSTTQNNKVDVQAVFSSLNIENLLTVTTVASEENKDTTKPKKSSTSGRPFDCPHPEDDGGSSGNPNFDGSFIKPTTGRYSCGFGTDSRITCRTGRAHYGIDISPPSGTPIVASAAGKVIKVLDSCVEGNGPNECGGGYGNHIIIDHGVYITVYAHNLTGSAMVNVGDKVSQGQRIAKVGTTGRSTGPHIHFEIRRKQHDKDSRGEAIDPCTKIKCPPLKSNF